MYDHNRPKSIPMAVPKGHTPDLTLSDHQAAGLHINSLLGRGTLPPNDAMLSDSNVYNLKLLTEKGERGGGIARRALCDFLQQVG